MKNYLFLFTLAFFIITSNIKSQEDDFVIPRNADYTMEATDGTQVIARDVYSMKSKLKRNIQLVNPKTNTLIGQAFITLETLDKDQNMYDQLRNDPEKFSGILTIEADGELLLVKQIDNGTASTGRTAGSLGGVPGPVHNPNLRCTLRNIHDCVAYRIDDMSWLQYAACLLTAPGCYARQWAICTIDVCLNHMQYTNPN